MLLIGDIHINAKQKGPLIETVLGLVAEHSGEQTIVFVGDYVYHFAYDRKSLLALFEVFVQLYQQGKDVYVLAGNHDWLSGEFVYREGKYAFDVMMESAQAQSAKRKGEGKLVFVTEPMRVDIEGEAVLFLPYNAGVVPANDATHGVAADMLPIVAQAEDLLAASTKREQFAGRVNRVLAEEVRARRAGKQGKEIPGQARDDGTIQGATLTVIHHYYVEGVQFPGERGRFGFKDVALDRRWLDVSDVRLIAGHLHKSFVHQNFLCVGSLWATSPLETNQVKVAVRYRQGVVQVQPVWVNGYIKMVMEDRDEEGVVGMRDLEQHLQGVWDEVGAVMTSNACWDVSVGDLVLPSWQQVALQLQVGVLDYTRLEEWVSGEVLEQVGDIKLYKKREDMSALLAQLDVRGKDVTSGFSDWKQILQEYVGAKYGEEKEEYMAVLRELELV